MKRYNKSQTDRGEVLDDCYHVNSALEALRFGCKGHVITIIIFYVILKILSQIKIL